MLSPRFFNKIILPAFIASLISLNFWKPSGKQNDPDLVPVPPSLQRTGDIKKGFSYLTTGDYVKGGIPYEIYLLGKGRDKLNYLNRSGLNGTVSHEYTVVTASNGEQLVAPNCLQCHAQVFNDSLVIGLGNSQLDFTMGKQLNAANMNQLGSILQNTSPAKYAASKDFLKIAATIGPLIQTSVRGVNPADRLAAVLVAHRDPKTLVWLDSATMTLPAEVIPSDVPAWWLLKKKNAMFYTGFGRGDFGRFLMASNLLTTKDSSEAAAVDKQIQHVLAYINSLQPPKFPAAINGVMAKNGSRLFNDKCSKCHGKYGEHPEFPNLLVPAAIIKTDSALYSSNYQHPQFVEWFNSSWFAMGDHPAKLVPFAGYLAPPLDGVWCTAPYLHNGSVPTLEAVLYSRARPAYWSRDFNKPVYNYNEVGWPYRQYDSAGGTGIYNTKLRGYGNYGHYFGDRLTDAERKEIIEYLKTI